jgi:hypothetical protein
MYSNPHDGNASPLISFLTAAAVASTSNTHLELTLLPRTGSVFGSQC